MPTRWLLSVLTTLLISWAIKRWGTLLFLGIGSFGLGSFNGAITMDSAKAELLTASAPQERQIKKPAIPNYFMATVVRVVDGDTIDVVPNTRPKGRSHRLRLAGIDTPEKRGSTACPAMAAIASDVLNDYLVAHDNQVQVIIEKKIRQKER